MNLIRLAIERPIAVIAVVLMVVMFGMVALQTIPIQLSPDVNRPVITVTTAWPGTAPAEVENRFRNRLSGEMQKATTPKEIDLEEDFTRAASGEQGEGKTGTSEGPQPKKGSKVDQYRRQKASKRDRDKDRER